jgi:mannose/cellobiose epimerase-like protein (N-acyl-D-glucosamine 2-epimerase family)
LAAVTHLADQYRHDLARCAGEAKSWLFDQAAPLWASAGFCKDGMFAEFLDAQGQAHAVPRRLRVQARQIYAFCELGKLGWTGDWRTCAGQAADILVQRGRRDDGFFIHTFSSDGAPLDLRADLYDHAFALFCLANAGAVLSRPALFDVAGEVMDILEKHWRHPAGGFLEGEIDGPPRRQNPHMHMLEATRALWMYSRMPRWKACVYEIATLCASRFIEPKTGALTEYFAGDWSRLTDDEGRIVEPGHCLEWAWLFEVLAEAGVPGCIEPSDRLARFARSYGIDRGKGVAVNEVMLDGKVKDGAVRLWPQTERMKAALARFRRTGSQDEAQEACAAYRGLRRHLDTPVAGLWHERQYADGRWMDQPSPASSFYHIVCGLSELIRTAAC